MTARANDWESPFVKRFVDLGRTEGTAHAVLRVLDRRGIGVPDGVRDRIARCSETETLERWLDHAATASSQDGVVNVDSRASVMTRPSTDWESAFLCLDLGRAEGRAEGRALGWVQGRVGAVLKVLASRGLAVPDDVRARILACTNHELLDTWIDRASTAQSLADVDIMASAGSRAEDPNSGRPSRMGASAVTSNASRRHAQRMDEIRANAIRPPGAGEAGLGPRIGVGPRNGSPEPGDVSVREGDVDTGRPEAETSHLTSAAN